MAGIREGYLDGLRAISGIQQLQALQERASWERAERQKTMRLDEQEARILSTAFQAQNADDSQISALDSQTRLAQQMRQAGQALLGTNPKRALDMLQEASKIELQGQNQATEMMQTEILKNKLVGARAANVVDQESLTDFVVENAKIGKIVPKQYQTWSPETAAWLNRQREQGISASEQQQFALQKRRIELDEKQLEVTQQENAVREQYRKTEQALKQQGMELRRQALQSKGASEIRMKGKTDAEAERGILMELDTSGAFKKLPRGLQQEAAADVRLRAQKIYTDALASGEENALSAEDALRMARESVLGELVLEKGFLFDTATRRASGRQEETPPKSVTPRDVTLDDVKAKAMSAWGEFDLNKYDYRVSPEGKLQRRAKQ